MLDFSILTFSITNARGLISLIARKYSLTSALFMLIKLVFCRLALENPWQGGPPITTSMPSKRLLSDLKSYPTTFSINTNSSPGSGMLCLYVSLAYSLISAAATNLKCPVCLKPRLRPPAPANKSIVFSMNLTLGFLVILYSVGSYPRIHFTYFESPLPIHFISGHILLLYHLLHSVPAKVEVITNIGQ